MFERATRLWRMSPEDDDLRPGERSARETLAHRVEVEEGLRRVGVPPVAAVEDVPVEVLGCEVRRPGDVP